MIIDGKAIAHDIEKEMKQVIATLSGRKPCLAVILVGDHPPSHIYVKRKTRACKHVGMDSFIRQFPEELSEENLIKEITLLNTNPKIDGILVQLPLPPHIDPKKVTQCISPEKDVDGFHPINMGKMLIGETDGFSPCTPLGIKTLFERTSIDLTGEHVLIIGRSNIVGKPRAALLMQRSDVGNATVTIAHRKTKNIQALCQEADVIIIAIGQPKFLTADIVKEGAIIIDVGINKVDDSSSSNGYKIIGDVDFENVKDKCAYITPVPGGVGPMTIAMLLKNTLKSYEKRVLCSDSLSC